MLRIGELADLAGVTPRTIRHYHQVGLLPEPARTAGGYRSYGLSHASRLIQICRLTAVGLGLSEVAAALAGPDRAARQTDMREVLADLDAELAAEEQTLAQRRAAIRRVLDDGVDPTLDRTFAEAEQLTTVEADLLRVARALGDEPAGEGPVQPPADAAEQARWRELDALFATVAEVPEDDPRVPEVAEQILPRLLELLPQARAGGPEAAQVILGRLVLAELSPAQHRVIRLLLQHG
ncbi:MAG TPA: MerR family transcriptional regulator [Pilimelia sp.]|nr:MerR family transcriptional regulator [Pilimelia sp.]